MFCRQCGYNLYGLPENRCPECGKAFDPHDPKTYWRHASSLSRRRWANRIVVALFALLILCSVAGVSLWYPWHREQAAVRMVQYYGGNLQTRTVSPRWLPWLPGKRDAFLLQRVDSIDLAFTWVTDADLTSLRKLPYLRSLKLTCVWKLTDAGLMNLRGLKQLAWLDLRYTHVTDAGLANLKELKQLQRLDLACVPVTDAGLMNLRDLKQFQWLDLDGTKVTDAGVAELQKALPNCRIWH